MSANPLLSIEGLTASVDEKTILHNVNLNAVSYTHLDKCELKNQKQQHNLDGKAVGKGS